MTDTASSSAKSSAASPRLGLSDDACREVIRFRDERGWAVHHNPKDLAISISIEAAELLEAFQWSAGDLECEAKKTDVAEELADVVTYAVMLADRLGVSLDGIVRAKLEKTKKKYPVAAASNDPQLAAYEAMKQKARLERAELAAVEAAAPELLRFRAFLAEHPAGRWTSASDDRIYFVAYAPESVAFWKATEAAASAFPAEALAGAIPTDFPSYPTAEDLAPLSFAGLVALLWKAVKEERIHDGAFLSAAESGVLGRTLDALAAKLAAA